MKKFIYKILDKGFFVIGMALGAGVLAMVGILQLYNWMWAEPQTEAVADNPVERALAGGTVEGPVQVLNLRSIPGPFFSPGSTREIGFEFLNVSIDIAGEENFDAANAEIDELVRRFTEAVRERGAGREDLPGEADFERLATRFLKIAREDMDLEGVLSVRVHIDEGG